MISTWTNPAGGEEYAAAFDRGRDRRLLVVPALFDEGNKLRHFAIEVMRRLDHAGIDAMLPDLPGTNESLDALETQTVSSWQLAMEEAARSFEATEVLAIRGGCLVAPSDLPVWRHAPATGSSILRGLIRARLVSSKEAGASEDRESLLRQARQSGLELAGYRLGPGMIRELETAEPSGGAAVANVQQAELGGAGLWLRAEPDFDTQQADALASIVAAGLQS